MKMFLRARYALAGAIALGLLNSSARADESATQALFFGDKGGVEQAALEGDSGTVDLVQFQSGVGAGLNLGASGCSHQIVVGGEFLMVRASHSQSTAYLETDVVNQVFTYHQMDFDYEPSFRVYAGCRIPECGQEFRFTYTNFNSDGDFISDAQTTTNTITGPFEVITSGNGDQVFGSGSVNANIYDLACMKTIPLGCALGCCDCGDCCDTCCDDCCDPCGCGDGCGCCFCPAWDITWSGGVRFADIDSQFNYGNIIVATTVAPRTAISRMDFKGVGLRGGVLGRRYFGKTGMTSVYLKADISLLVGDVDYYAEGTAFARHQISTTQVIPVTDIEAGGTVALTKNLSVSGGYMLSAWHDLGHRAEYDFGAAGVQLESMDDANILSFDGFFLRAEGTF